jgi:hypothetical protein
MAPKIPASFPRSLGGKSTAMVVRARAKRAPPPRPWSPRKRMSWAMFWERPERAEPRRKRTTAVRRMPFREKSSVRRPKMGAETVEARR